MFEPAVRILHVDDSETNRYVVARMLQNAGFNVTEATNGTDGLASAIEQQPDLVILDVKLPDISGFEVCRQIKTHPATATIPVLHLSASFVESRDKAQGLDQGADAYLAQPVEAIELIATVRALLRIRRAEEASIRLAQEWQTTFDSINDGVGLLDRDGRFLRCNQALIECLGVSLAEILGCLHHEVLQTVLGIGHGGCFRLVKETHYRQVVEMQSRTNRWFAKTIDPVLNEQGNFTGAVFILTDITDRKGIEAARKRTEAELRSSEERFRLLMENVKDYSIFFCDPQGFVTSWSLGAESILGYTEAEAIGQHSGIFFTPEDRAAKEDQNELDTAVSEGRAEDERWHIRKDGSLFWASGFVTPLFNEAGQLRGFCKIMRDITDRKLIEDERAQLLAREQEARAASEATNRMKDEFLATLSHELRSPLNAMLGWTRLLNTRQFDETTRTRALQTIERNAKAQAQLVEDLLDVSRIIQGKLRLNMQPLNLTTVIEAAIETVRPAAEAKNIQIHTQLQPVGKVAGDSDRLQQVVWNLLSNAIKFTPSGGHVEVQLEEVKEANGAATQEPATPLPLHPFTRLTIIDNGHGINPEFVPYVFDRFRQADSSITRSYGGLGLGLAIVRHLVELHGGTVAASSLGLDRGATFTIQLPLLTLHNEVVNPEKDSVSLSALPLDRLRVLIVDDEADTRELLVAALQTYGAIVTAAASVQAAIAILPRSHSDVLVSDIGMPDEDGYSLIRQVRLLPADQGGNIPAIALTAYASAEDQAKALSAGFQAHLAKPVEPENLAAAIARLAESDAIAQSL